MKHTIILCLISFLLTPVWAHAQATRTLKLGKRMGIDTHIPIQIDQTALNRKIMAQLEQARPKVSHAKGGMGILTKEDLRDEKEYVVTPEGDIQRGSMKACEYFARWEQRQHNNPTMSEEEFQNNRNMLLIMLDIPQDYCVVLLSGTTQPHRPVAVKPDEEVPALTAEKIIPPVEPIQVSSIPAEQTPSTQVDNFFHEIRSLRNAAPDIQIPTPRKAKRHLRKFLKVHQADVQEALALREKGKHINPGKKRILGAYDVLCVQYEGATGKKCADFTLD